MNTLSKRVSHIPSEEERERELAYLATKLAEKQLKEGTARAQVIVHYLKASSPRENIERRMLEAKIAMLENQVQAYQNDMATQQLVVEAMDALRTYRGEEEEYF